MDEQPITKKRRREAGGFGIGWHFAVWALAATLVFTLVGSVLPSGLGLMPAFAATSSLGQAQADLAQAKKELKALQVKLDKLAKQQVDAENDLETTRIHIDEVQARIAAAEDDLAGLRKQLGGRLAEMYKNRGSSLELLNVVFSGDDTSLNTILERLSVVTRVAQSDSQLIASVQDRVQELNRLKADLSAQKAAEQKKDAKYGAAQDRTLQSLEGAKDDYNRLHARVATLREEARKREEEARRAEEARKAAEAAAAAKKKSATTTRRAATSPVSARADWVFPVAGPNSFSDNFGAPRYAGGYHTHKGVDIMTARYTPLVAVEDAVVSSTNPYDTGLGGITIHLRNGRGTTYYYAHLQSIKGGIRAGVRVKAGQVIGYAGNTGDARTTSVHLHFEIRVNGVAIDPYPTLVKYR